MNVSHPYNIKPQDVLRIRREELNITQKELADELGISSMGLSHYEVGSRQPRLDFLEKWAAALKMEINVFLTKSPLSQINESQ